MGPGGGLFVIRKELGRQTDVALVVDINARVVYLDKRFSTMRDRGPGMPPERETKEGRLDG